MHLLHGNSNWLLQPDDTALSEHKVDSSLRIYFAVYDAPDDTSKFARRKSVNETFAESFPQAGSKFGAHLRVVHCGQQIIFTEGAAVPVDRIREFVHARFSKR